MLKTDKKSYERIKAALDMPDSNDKLRLISNLTLEAEPLTPLHTKLLDEGNRLLEAGYYWS